MFLRSKPSKSYRFQYFFNVVIIRLSARLSSSPLAGPRLRHSRSRHWTGHPSLARSNFKISSMSSRPWRPPATMVDKSHGIGTKPISLAFARNLRQMTAISAVLLAPSCQALALTSSTCMRCNFWTTPKNSFRTPNVFLLKGSRRPHCVLNKVTASCVRELARSAIGRS